MMKPQSEDNPHNSHSDEVVDGRLRELLQSHCPADTPLCTESLVRAKIRGRRSGTRLISAAIALTSVAAVALLMVRWQPEPTPQRTEIAAAVPALSDRDSAIQSEDDAAFTALAAAPPIVAFAVLGQEQVGLLEELKLLLED